MQNNRKVFDVLMSKTKIYLAIIFILLVIVSIENKAMIIPSIIIYAGIVIYSYYANNIANYSYMYGNLANVIVLMILVYVISYILVLGIAINANIYHLDIENNELK